jgi:O-antigen ligase
MTLLAPALEWETDEDVGARTSARHRRATAWPRLATLLVFDLIALVPLITTLVTPRTFQSEYDQNSAGLAKAIISSSRPWATDLGQASVVALLALLALGLGVAVYRRHITLLFPLAGLAYAVAFGLSSRYAAHHTHNWVLATLPLAVLAFGIAPLPTLAQVHRHALALFTVYAVGSLAAIPVIPNVVLERNYESGILPWPHVRLHGITPHANSLGAMMALALLLHAFGPRIGNRPWRLGGWVLFGSCLLLSQSKTTLYGLVLVLVATALLRFIRSRAARVTAVLIACAATATLPFVAGPSADGVLTGRPDVWRITLTDWRAHPVLGYGLTIWDTRMKIAYLPQLHWAPGQGHNEVVQTLGQAGLLGCAALLLLMLAVVVGVARRHHPAAALATAVAVFIVLRGATETTLGRYSPDVGLLILLITLLVIRQGEDGPDPEPAEGSDERGRRSEPLRMLRATAGVAVAAVAMTGCIAGFGGSAARPGNSVVAATANKPVSAEMFGMHVLGLSRYPSTQWPLVHIPTIRIWDTGTSWAELEKSPGVYNWAPLDTQIGKAKKHGTKVLMTLGMTPTWASSNPTQPNPYGTGAAAPPTSLKVWRSYVRALATRYRGEIEAYEVWNEPNDPRYYTGTAQQLADLTREAKLILQQSDPQAQLVSPAPYWGSTGQKFLTDYFGAGAAKYIDDVGIHLDEMGAPEEMVDTLTELEPVLLSLGIADKPLWNTETGYGNSSGIRYTEAESRGIVARDYLIASAHHVARFYWYAWDDPKWVGVYMTEPNRTTPTAAARAYVQTQRLLVGAVNAGCTEASSNGVWTCTLVRGARRSLVLWQPTKATVVDVPSKALGVFDIAGNVVKHPAGRMTLSVEPLVLPLRN